MDKKEVKRGRSKGSGERKAFSYEFSQIRFASHEGDLFRATVSSVADGVLIWLESKKTKQQWQATVTNVGECGPSGVPEEAVVAFLKKALELVVVDGEDMKTDRDDPTVDFVLEDEDISLILTLSMGGVWKPEFVFALLPVGLDKIDVLEAKLRDAQDEIESLKVELQNRNTTSVFLALSSKTTCASGNIVIWDGDTPREVPQESFRLSPDFKKVHILQTGVYQVTVRLTGTNTSNGASLGLQKNDTDYAFAQYSDNHGHTITVNLTETMRLEALDTLQVRCGFNGNSQTNGMGNRFTILFLGF